MRDSTRPARRSPPCGAGPAVATRRWCCGTHEYGRTGHVFGAKRLLRIATEGGADAHGVKKILAGILQMPFLTDTDFIASSLWPNNPSLHPPILYGLFKDWDGATPYDAAKLPTLIYADMRTGSAKALVEMDTELTTIVKTLAKLCALPRPHPSRAERRAVFRRPPPRAAFGHTLRAAAVVTAALTVPRAFPAAPPPTPPHTHLRRPAQSAPEERFLDVPLRQRELRGADHVQVGCGLQCADE